MVFYCPHCGNEETFYEDRSFTEYGTERVYMYGDGEEFDYGDRDTGDTDYDDGGSELFCNCCNKSALYFSSENELNEYKSTHKLSNKIKPNINWKEKLQNLGALKEVK